MKPFRKRTYAGPGDFFADLRFLAANRRALNRLMRAGNPAGNTVDRFLYWVSRGRLGGD